MKITAREVLGLDPVYLLSPESSSIGNITVIYDDGVERLHRKTEVIFNRFCWELFREYPEVKILPKYDVTEIVSDGDFNFNTHINQLELIFGGICEDMGLLTYSSKTPLIEKTWNVYNWIFNDLVCNISEYVTSIDAVDLVNVVKSEEMMEISNGLEHTPESVDRSYKQIRKFISSSSSRNNFIAAYKSKAISDNQANQCLGPRGFVTDIDRTVFGTPITNGFIRGLGSLFELIAESLTAAKSLNASEGNIRDSEYASRLIQILDMSVRHVINEDCGSDKYMLMAITPTRLRNMKGVNYLKEDGTLTHITGNEDHLVDKVIKIRTPLSCIHPNVSDVCSVCLGRISQNFKENSNLGYTLVAYVMEKISQAMLGKKHITQSVKMTLLDLSSTAVPYFSPGSNNYIYLNDNIDTDKLTLVLPYKQLTRLIDVLNLQGTNVSLGKIGELDTIGVLYNVAQGTQPYPVDISYKDRSSILTLEFLTHIKESAMGTDPKGNFIVPMKGFDKQFPVFQNQLKEEDLLAFVNEVSSIVNSTKKNIGNTPEDRLITLFDTMIERIDCNLTAVGVMVYASTVADPTNGDYGLGRFSDNIKQAKANEIIRNRSSSPFLIYERQTTSLLTKPMEVFSSRPKLGHPMDVLFAPKDSEG